METRNKYKKNAAIFVLLVGIFLIGIVLAAAYDDHGMPRQDITSPEEAAKYLMFLGWEADVSTAEVKQTILPETFDDTFSEYNNMQLQQGFDLTKYAGKEITIYTLQILNYNSSGNVYATLIVYNEELIGGDIHAAEMDGFMHGLK